MSKLLSILAQCAESPHQYSSHTKEYKLAQYAVKEGMLTRTEKGYETTNQGKLKLNGNISQDRDYDRLLVILSNANGKGYISNEAESSSVANAKNNGWITYRKGYGFTITPKGKEKLRQVLVTYGITTDLWT